LLAARRGLSAGLRGRVRRWENLVEDIAQDAHNVSFLEVDGCAQ
jgi:hypothetical protein